MKKILQKIIGKNQYLNLAQLNLMRSNYYRDFILYRKYSTVLGLNSFENKEAAIILDYHSIEKGFLFNEMKPSFAKQKVTRLHRLLHDPQIQEKANQSQIKVAYQVMCRYYEVHQENNYSLGFYSKEDYDFYKKILAKNYDDSFTGIIDYGKEQFYNSTEKNFEEFANSRKSIRNFTGEKVNSELIFKAIQLSATAPSVCNRQASKVYLVEDKIKIDKLLQIQGGMTGYTEDISQLLILTNDRRYYYTVGERNQLYIDGGIFLMNLLYSLHFYKIAACPANWGKNIQEEASLHGIIDLAESEKIICMIPIGIAEDNFKVCLSKRREASEILSLI